MKAARRRRVLVRIFMAPALLALSSAIGLAAALLGDGIWDAVSWLALGLPLLVLAWHCTKFEGRV